MKKDRRRDFERELREELPKTMNAKEMKQWLQAAKIETPKNSRSGKKGIHRQSMPHESLHDWEVPVGRQSGVVLENATGAIYPLDRGDRAHPLHSLRYQ